MADKPDVKVRVLVAHGGHRPNHVITLSASEAKALKASGHVDDDADAVAWAEANEPQPEHAPEPAAQVAAEAEA